MGWHEMVWHVMRWVGIKWDGVRCDWIRWDDIAWDGMGWDCDTHDGMALNGTWEGGTWDETGHGTRGRTESRGVAGSARKAAESGRTEQIDAGEAIRLPRPTRTTDSRTARD